MQTQLRDLSPFIYWLLFGLALGLYANAINHDYTQDDAIVIYDNMYTTAGVSGIPGLLTKDTFYGFFKVEGKDKLVKGGRYRPLTPILFAIEYEVFGRRPMVGHLVNAVLYGLLIMLLYRVLTTLWCHDRETERWLTYMTIVAVAFFAAHPIHTEAVANIKGRDEIVALLASLGALWYAIRYVDEGGIRSLIGVSACFFAGLMSKENTVTFLAVLPLSIYLFRGRTVSQCVRPVLAALSGTVVFLAIRTAVLGVDFGGESFELMNNPFIKAEGGQYVAFTAAEWFSTITYTLGKYIQLLIWPHPLTHDYYPRHIDIMSLGDWQVWLSLAAHIFLLIVAVRTMKTQPIVAWAIGFYVITLSIVSNIVFPIGTNMSERFVFMPSVGYAVLLAYLLYRYVYCRWPILAFALTVVILLGYGVKTVTRNRVWKDDFTLFTTDVNTSSRSAKVLNAAGGALSTRAATLAEGPARTKMLKEAEVYLKEALVIHPNYTNAALLLGNVEYYQTDYAAAIEAYNRALSINPDFVDAQRNLAIAYRDAGRQAGEQDRDIAKAKRYLEQSIKLAPEDVETLRLLGVASGVSGDHAAAVKYFTKVTESQPDNQAIINNLIQAHQQLGNVKEAEQWRQRLSKK